MRALGKRVTPLLTAEEADGRTRTGDILFTREVLYQLSYVGVGGRV
jgi:hypothetical protein